MKIKTNLFALDDKTMIKALRGAILVQTFGSLGMFIGANLGMRAMAKALEKDQKIIKLQNRAINRFVDLSPPEVSKKISEEFKFDVITMDLNL